jgi:asparagine synthetase B (glutamine-hydrolysing)
MGEMAVLLALIDDRDDEALEPVWRALRARARARGCEEGSERRGNGWRLWAARSLPSEPEPLIDLGGDGRTPRATLLLDRAIGDHDPANRGLGEWSSRTLFDGTACASIRIDAADRRIQVTRDVMGQRSLVWANAGRGLVIASGEDILRAHPDLSSDLDMGWFAALLAGVPPALDASAFERIRVLPAGVAASLVGTSFDIRHQPMVLDEGVAQFTDMQALACFREHVDQAVARALRGVSRPAVSLSAGIDSPLVAESVARQWNGQRRPVAITFGFDRWPEIDERGMAKAVAERLGFEFCSFAADDLVPMRPGLDRPVCPDTPYATPYREIKQAAHRIAAEEGCDAVLSGNFGDHLYAHPARWLVDAVRFGRLDVVRSALLAQGLAGAVRDPGLRILARPWRLRSPPSPAGLSRLAPSWRDRLESEWRDGRMTNRGWPRPSQALHCFGAGSASSANGEDWYAARHRLAFRQPLRDPDLTRLMLSLPAFHSTRGAVTKWLARAALRGRLPEGVVERPKGSDLTPFAEAADRSERHRLLALASQVRPWLEPLLSDRGRQELEDGDLPWLLATVAVWCDVTAERPRLCL